MASVTVMTAAHIQELLNAAVKSVQIDGSGFLTFTLVDDTVVDVGSVIADSDLTAAVASLVESATIDGSNHLILHKADGSTTLDVGSFTDAFVKSATIDGSNHLILTLGDNSTTDVGSVEPTPIQTTVTTGLVMASGWSSGALVAVKANGMCSMSMSATRSGGTITGSATGNITDTLVATLPAGIRPATRMTGLWENSDVSHGGVRIDTNGAITILSMTPTSTIGSGEGMGCSSTYIIGG